MNLLIWLVLEMQDKIFFFIHLFISGCVGSSLLCPCLVVVRGGVLIVAVRGLLIAVASLVAEHKGSRRAGFSSCGAGLSCSAACGIFPDQGSNPCPLQ